MRRRSMEARVDRCLRCIYLGVVGRIDERGIRLVVRDLGVRLKVHVSRDHGVDFRADVRSLARHLEPHITFDIVR
jgi:hypothetical protein